MSFWQQDRYMHSGGTNSNICIAEIEKGVGCKWKITQQDLLQAQPEQQEEEEEQARLSLIAKRLLVEHW